MSDEAPADKRRRIPNWAKWLIGVPLGLYLLVNVAFFVMAASAKSNWEEIEADLRAAGEPLTFDDILASRKLENSENSSLRRAVDAMLANESTNDSPGVLVFDHACDTEFFEGISEVCVEPTWRFVEANRQVLVLLQSDTMNPGPLGINLEAALFDNATEEWQLFSGLRSVAKLSYADALLQVLDGDFDAAANAVHLQLRIAQPNYEEPSLIAALLGISSDAIALRLTETLVNSTQFAAEGLEQLQQSFEDAVRTRHLLPSLRGERALVVRLTDAAATRQTSESEQEWRDSVMKHGIWRPSTSSFFPRLSVWFLYGNRNTSVASLSRLIECGEDIVGILDAAHSLSAEFSSGMNPTKQFARITIPSVNRSIELHARLIGSMRSTVVALAAERFRIDRGRFPEAAAELVPNYLDELPADPFDGQPIRFIHIEDGIVAYTIGDDRIDDGGAVQSRTEGRARDFGVRLVNPELRGIRLVAGESDDDSDKEYPTG